VAPELAGCAEAGLHLVCDQNNAVLLGDGAQALEEVGGCVVVSPFALDRLDDKSSYGAMPWIEMSVPLPSPLVIIVRG
jgi:hypothetical protein